MYYIIEKNGEKVRERVTGRLPNVGILIKLSPQRHKIEGEIPETSTCKDPKNHA